MAISIMLFLVDIAVIMLSTYLAFLLRYGWNIPEVNFIPYRDNFIFLTFVYLFGFSLTRAFRSRFVSYWDMFSRIFVAMLYGTLFNFAMVYVFRFKWMKFPSSVLLIAFVVGTLLAFLCNGLILRLVDRIKKRVVLIGANGEDGWLARSPAVEELRIDRIEQLLEHQDVDEVVICHPVEDHQQLNLLIYLLLRLRVSVVFAPSVYKEMLSGSVMEGNGSHFLATFIGRRSDAEEFLIRALDVTVSLIVLMLALPLMLIAALLIKLTSPGPVFYRQVRVAKDGRTFSMLKFRTMVVDAERNTGPVLAVRADPRVTPLGRFLRDTRLDELPQLINVLYGDMSLVGPRPERPHFVRQHPALREIRLAVKPGLTGLAQIRSDYDLHPRHKTKYDWLYIQRRSLLLNIFILAKTIPVMLQRRGQ